MQLTLFLKLFFFSFFFFKFLLENKLRYNKDIYPQVVSYGGGGAVVLFSVGPSGITGIRDYNKKVPNLLLFRIIFTGMSDIQKIVRF